MDSLKSDWVLYASQLVDWTYLKPPVVKDWEKVQLRGLEVVSDTFLKGEAV